MKNTILTIILVAINIIAVAQDRIQNKEGKYAVANQRGVAVTNYYDAIYDYQFGIAQVRQLNKFGAIDTTGKIVIEINYRGNEIGQKLLEYQINNAPKTAETYLLFADKYKNLGKDSLMLDCYQKALDKSDKTAETYLLFADKYKNLGKDSLVIDCYKNALNLSPQIIENFDKSTLLYIYPTLNNFDANILQSAFNKFIWTEIDVKNCSINKQFDLAINIRKALMQQTDFTQFGELAWWCVFCNDFEGAIWSGKIYESTVSEENFSIGTISNLALGYLFNGNLDDAKQIYSKYKDQPYKEGTGKDIFLVDINQVLDANIKPKNEKDIETIKKLSAIPIFSFS